MINYENSAETVADRRYPSIALPLDPDSRARLMGVWADLTGQYADDRAPRFDNPGDWRISEVDVIECLDHALKSERAFNVGRPELGDFYLKGFDIDPSTMPLDDVSAK